MHTPAASLHVPTLSAVAGGPTAPGRQIVSPGLIGVILAAPFMSHWHVIGVQQHVIPITGPISVSPAAHAPPFIVPPLKGGMFMVQIKLQARHAGATAKRVHLDKFKDSSLLTSTS